MHCVVANWEAAFCTSWRIGEVALVAILLLNPGLDGLEYKTAGFFIATMIEAGSYKMILQVLCIQLLYQKKFYVCKLIYLETEAVKETS